MLLYSYTTIRIVKLIKYLKARKMWLFRRMLRISRTLEINHEEILCKAQAGKKNILKTVKKRERSFRQIILLSKIKGKRERARRRISRMKNTQQWTGLETIVDIVLAAKIQK